VKGAGDGTRFCVGSEVVKGVDVIVFEVNRRGAIVV
jgi:hypothetical protein